MVNGPEALFFSISPPEFLHAIYTKDGKGQPLDLDNKVSSLTGEFRMKSVGMEEENNENNDDISLQNNAADYLCVPLIENIVDSKDNISIMFQADIEDNTNFAFQSNAANELKSLQEEKIVKIDDNSEYNTDAKFKN